MNNDMSNSSNNKDEYLVENKKSNLFNIIIGIATLLVAILGATFAYFSATAISQENDVNLKSAYLSISYDGGTKIQANELIPSSLHVALTEYQNPPTGKRCIDEKGKEVCYVYQFTVTSEIDETGTTDIIGSIKVNSNGFENLSYLLYEVTFATDDEGSILIEDGLEKVESYNLVETNFNVMDSNAYGDMDTSDYKDIKFEKFLQPIDNYDDSGNYSNTTYPVACLFGYSDGYEDKSVDDVSRCKPYSITNGERHTYQLVVWLAETGSIQYEQRKEFGGTVTIDVSGSSDSSGYADGEITGTLNG